MKWKAADGPAKVDNVVREVLECYKIDVTRYPDILMDIRTCMANICKYFKKRWVKHNRTSSQVLKCHAEYFDSTFCLPEGIIYKIRSTSNFQSRKSKPFGEVAECTKRRRTEELRSNYTTEELAYAAQMSLRSAGNNAAAAVVKEATLSAPSTASEMLSSLKQPKTVIPYTGSEALALLIDQNLTKSQYVKIRKNAEMSNVNVYPSYNTLLKAKQECYPQSIEITETRMEVTLQALLNHTCHRILQASSEKIENFSDDELLHLKLTTKWGCDGSSGHSEYKQIFNENEDTSDSHIFLTSIVPIKAEVDGKVLFQNPTPSSTRYCRPLRIQMIKETIEVSIAEKNKSLINKFLSSNHSKA